MSEFALGGTYSGQMSLYCISSNAIENLADNQTLNLICGKCISQMSSLQIVFTSNLPLHSIFILLIIKYELIEIAICVYLGHVKSTSVIPNFEKEITSTSRGATNQVER